MKLLVLLVACKSIANVFCSDTYHAPFESSTVDEDGYFVAEVVGLNNR